jgi:hypothetical protein
MVNRAANTHCGDSLHAHISGVLEGVASSREKSAPYDRSGVSTLPLPFFGDVESARVLTVGVNPSAGEFIGRAWPETMSADDLRLRLVHYFAGAPVPPHPWFATWSEALSFIGLSYRDGAAHADLSPRATASMGSQSDHAGFARLVEQDAKWFFELLPLCQALRVLLVAGCVTKRWYMHDFLARVASAFGYSLTGHAESTGTGRVGFLHLAGPGCDLPVFFCSVSPSGRNRSILVERVRDHKMVIAGWLGTVPL